jgi:hypothetical protein
MKAELEQKLLNNDEEFIKYTSLTLANQLTLLIDRLITSKRLTFTQKQVIERYRDNGVFNNIILGNFHYVSLLDLITIVSEFKLGLSVSTLDISNLISSGNDITLQH